jgi:hypothetical protein
MKRWAATKADDCWLPLVIMQFNVNQCQLQKACTMLITIYRLLELLKIYIIMQLGIRLMRELVL